MLASEVLDYCAGIVGDDDPAFRALLFTSLKGQLRFLWDEFDWNFKHKFATFPTVASQATYAVTSLVTDLRSSYDIEYMYDSTNGRKIFKRTLRELKLLDPKSQASNSATMYAPWDVKTISMYPIPNAVATINILYLGKPIVPTDETQDLDTVSGLPDYMNEIFKKYVLAEAFLLKDDARRNNLLEEIERKWLPKAKRADEQNLDNDLRIKNWEEEMSQQSVGNYDDFLRAQFWGNDLY